MPIKTIRRLLSLLIMTSLMISAYQVSYAAAQSLAFNATADAYVNQSSPDTNYGSSTSLRADNSPQLRSYLRFVVSGLNGAAFQSAKLRIYTNSANSAGYSVRSLADNTWSEGRITYNNSPAAGSVIASSKSFGNNTWVEVDVSSYVKAEGTYNLVLTTTSSTNIKLASRELAGKSPQLVVSVLSQTTPTSAPTLTSTALPTSTVAPSPTSTSLPTSTVAPSLTPNPSTATSTPTTNPPGSDWQPSFPIRAAFYYPWFPEAWTQSGVYPYTNYNPVLGFYSLYDTATIKTHIAMMQYANIQAGISSWWGQGDYTDTKFSGLLSATSGTNFRWSLYYEKESTGDPTISQIQSDLTYIRNKYGSDPSFLRVNGKFVVFVYADGNDGCGMADRWKQANTVGAYVVLKVFGGYASCASQPDSWHQYSPAVAADRQGSFSYSISPGFWLKGQSVRLARDITRWTQNVKDMVASNAKWQLVTTFNEWGEGTAVEPALEWVSPSGYGLYLDALHYNGVMP